ncbi:MAG: amylo-alpha-1,6-glucosidase [Anaerolineae bacterium]|nr:amylo-alpha-1,6-glucosidase [Anaerolineae bacterium]
MIQFGRAICNDFEQSTSREWLVTNGIGGYACGTIAGVLTRNYHGLLIAALHPPLGRTLTAVKLNETAIYDDRLYRLHTDHREDGSIDPRGFENIEHFALDGTTPVWTFAFADAWLEKRIWMEQGENTTYVQYTLTRATRPVQLSFKALVNYRDYHGSTLEPWVMQVTSISQGIRIQADEQATPFYLFASQGKITSSHEWITGFYKKIEAERGLELLEHHLCVAEIEVTLQPNQSMTFAVSLNQQPDLDGQAAYQRKQQYETRLINLALGRDLPETLILAADQFIAQRAGGHTVLAGYPWFTDWGRDTMIALPGLTLATGRADIAGSILRTFAKYVDRGMIPNRFPDEGEEPEYNTVDATLWFIEAIRAYFEATEDLQLVRDLFPMMREIMQWHQQGTRYRIGMDQNDGLLYAGEPGVQLTWMDVKIDDWVVTPRIGKPIEINALWYNALRIMSDFAWRLGLPFGDYTQLAERVRTNFGRFWNGLYCYDVIDGEQGHDATLRPNQIFAVSLHHSALSSEQQRAVLDICARYLLTPHGLRSLTRDDEAYQGIYIGDRVQRDSAYHQGTVWSWLIGPFVEAHLRVHNDRVVARSFLEPLIRHLEAHGLGSISEVFDGDAPFTPRGCFAQAWGVAEVIRAWALINR